MSKILNQCRKCNPKEKCGKCEHLQICGGCLYLEYEECNSN